jgi:hypothetical protein
MRVVDHLVFGVGSRDPLSLGIAASLVAVCAAAASAAPVWRAVKTDPSLTLKAQ